MTNDNTGFSLTIYSSDNLARYLTRQAGGKPFEWCGVEREREARKYFRQVIVAARLIADGKQREKPTFTPKEIRGQAWLQGWEIAKLTLADYLERYQTEVAFGKPLSEGYPLNTARVFISSKAFDLIEALEEYPYPQAFGENGLDLSSIRIAERKGGCVLEVRFFGKVCTISC